MSEHVPTGNIQSWSRNSIGLKVFLIIFIILLLLIPSFMVLDLIQERESRQMEASVEVGRQWAGEQTLRGPFLSIPYLQSVALPTGEMTFPMRWAHFLPEQLEISGTVESRTRHRGIFDIPVYTTDLQFAGNFVLPSFAEIGLPSEDIRWEEATITFLLSDLRGLRDYPVLTWDGTAIKTRSGAGGGQGNQLGFHAPVKVEPLEEGGGAISFSAAIDLRGSQGLYFEPLGKATHASLQADWPSPSFQGAFLPDEHEISDQDFQADWKVLDLNRAYNQQWVADFERAKGAGFGVNFFQPVDEYRQATRTAKYAGLFLVLTFATVFLVEILGKRRVHPVQYLLIGGALMIFFVLLLSLAEHIGFDLAYLVAGATITLLIGAYASAVLRSVGRAAVVGGIVAALYAVLFVVLQLEDLALLIGSLALVLAMATVMYVTRNIDWYEVNPSESP